ncbi:hypothetical protein EJ110_NYTH17195 [Nymphaea thermarum]|nr:hypothetical protein EJ110_NYTH17195 [Nymphaea thermarum]
MAGHQLVSCIILTTSLALEPLVACWPPEKKDRGEFNVSGSRQIETNEELYNYIQSLWHTTMERVFGLLKAMFSILKNHVSYQISTQVKLVQTTCVLHNFIINHNPNAEQFLSNDINDSEVSEIINDDENTEQTQIHGSNNKLHTMRAMGTQKERQKEQNEVEMGQKRGSGTILPVKKYNHPADCMMRRESKELSRSEEEDVVEREKELGRSVDEEAVARERSDGRGMQWKKPQRAKKIAPQNEASSSELRPETLGLPAIEPEAYHMFRLFMERFMKEQEEQKALMVTPEPENEKAAKQKRKKKKSKSSPTDQDEDYLSSDSAISKEEKPELLPLKKEKQKGKINYDRKQLT